MSTRISFLLDINLSYKLTNNILKSETDHPTHYIETKQQSPTNRKE